MAVKIVPLGTIVASVLEYEQFLMLNDYLSSEWVPADGRKIPTDEGTYGAISAGRVPDLRGVFIRGVNTMGDDAPDPDTKFLNPEEKTAGQLQQDQFGRHNHRGDYRWHPPAGGGDEVNKNLMLQGGRASTRKFELSPNGGQETRPKNMSVWYYIKVK